MQASHEFPGGAVSWQAVAAGTAGDGNRDVPAAASLLLGRYRLLSRIGSGRLGLIYAASDTGEPGLECERRVAIQIVNEQFARDPVAVDALRSGYAAVCAGRHPNVVKVLDVASGERSCFLVMELLEGVSARFVLNESGSLPIDELKPILGSVASALRFLHAKSIVHGKLAPESVFVTVDYEVKLLDIVPPVPAGVSGVNGWPGSEAAAAGSGLDDVFGLACLAYELMAGRHPYFSACTAAEAAQSGHRPRPLAALTDAQWRALLRGMDPDPDQRTPSMAALLHEFGIDGTERLRPPAPAVDAAAEPARAAAEAVRDAADRQDQAPPLAPGQAGAALSAPARPLADSPRRMASHRDRSPRRTGPWYLSLGLAIVAALTMYLAYYSPGSARDDMRAQDPAPAPFRTEPDAIGERPPLAPPIVVGMADADSREPGALGQGRGFDSPTPAAFGVQRVTPAAGATPAESAAPTESATPTESAAPAERAGSAPARIVGETAAVAAAMSNRPDFQLAQASIVRREGDTYAPIGIERSGALAAAAAVVWWISAESAAPEDDFADLGPATEHFAVGQDKLTVFVPLVNDGIDEDTESFSIHIGQRDASTGSLQSLGQTRIEIIDDD